MYLSNHPLGDRITAVQTPGDEFERIAVVEQFPGVVRIGLRHRLAFPEALRLIQRQPGPFDMGGVVGFEDQRPLAHLPNPVRGELRCLQKTPRPLDPGNCCGHAVGNREFGLKNSFHCSVPFRQ